VDIYNLHGMGYYVSSNEADSSTEVCYYSSTIIISFQFIIMYHYIYVGALHENVSSVTGHGSRS